ncbi:MAG: hypothetical protein DRO36_02915 [Candidatus Hecatellales archaeon]|nr:MAG: hypothetical protein DRO36_02915 [Candidatus Hecatellales archaeon]
MFKLISKIFAKRFYELTLKRDFAEAERVLEKIREKASKSGWDKGYIFALEGMLLAYKNKDDDYLFINRLQPDKQYLKKIKKDFEEKARNLLTNSDFDRGFFSAWVDLANHLLKTNFLEGLSKTGNSKTS